MSNQFRETLDRAGIPPQQLLDYHYRITDRLFASPERLGSAVSEPAHPIADGLRWRINPHTLAGSLRTALEATGVGFSYIINQGGRLLLHHRRGQARVSASIPWLGVADSGLSWDIDVPTNICSVSKFFTAVATILMLDDHGLTPLTPVASYLPEYWEVPSANSGITFRDLLRHEAGLGSGLPGSGNANFALARAQMELNAVGAGSFNYKNINYLILRATLPIIAGWPAPILPTGKSFNDSYWDLISATFYRDFCNERIFAAANVGPFDFVAPPESTWAYATPPLWPGAQMTDGTSFAGSGAWHMTLEDMMKAAAQFRHRSMMSTTPPEDLLTNQYGLNEMITTNAGAVYAKRGDYRANGNVLETALYFIPDDLELGVFINSGPSGPGSYNDAIGPLIAASAEVAI